MTAPVRRTRTAPTRTRITDEVVEVKASTDAGVDLGDLRALVAGTANLPDDAVVIPGGITGAPGSATLAALSVRARTV